MPSMKGAPTMAPIATCSDSPPARTATTGISDSGSAVPTAASRLPTAPSPRSRRLPDHSIAFVNRIAPPMISANAAASRSPVMRRLLPAAARRSHSSPVLNLCEVYLEFNSSGKVGAFLVYILKTRKVSTLAQRTKSKSKSSGSRSNGRNSPAKGGTAAKSRSSPSRSQNARTSQGKTRRGRPRGELRRVRRTTRARSRRQRTQRPRARTPPVTPSRRPPNSSKPRRSPPGRDFRSCSRYRPRSRQRQEGLWRLPAESQ